jgi:threonine/homoserine/homoserine lactone efflux protein
MEHGMQAAMRTVFTVFAGFWIVTLIVLFIGVGALLRKRERLLQARKHADH